LSYPGDEGTNGSGTRVAASIVEFSPWPQRQKAIAATNLCHLVDHSTQRIA
jgi:hypothetical protein